MSSDSVGVQVSRCLSSFTHVWIPCCSEALGPTNRSFRGVREPGNLIPVRCVDSGTKTPQVQAWMRRTLCWHDSWVRTGRGQVSSFSAASLTSLSHCDHLSGISRGKADYYAEVAFSGPASCEETSGWTFLQGKFVFRLKNREVTINYHCIILTLLPCSTPARDQHVFSHLRTV